jgi:hypothetical protein
MILFIIFASFLVVLLTGLNIRPSKFKVVNENETTRKEGALPGIEYPPTYHWLLEWEKALPQHNLSLSYPEGKSGRYVKFSTEIQMLGWNNCLHER